MEEKLNALVGLAAARADWVKVLGTKGVDLAVLAGVGLARAGSAALVQAMGVAAARPAGGPDGPGAGSAAGVRRGAESYRRQGRARLVLHVVEDGRVGEPGLAGDPKPDHVTDPEPHVGLTRQGHGTSLAVTARAHSAIVGCRPR